MKETAITISKNPSLPQAEDYNQLRADGFTAIEELGSAQWTDYNAHDPGITLLEALCYALAEQGYRSGFDIADILTEESGYIPFRQALFTARRILTNNPLTINDYRRSLIDLKGVANAWLLCKECACETTFYAECREKALFHAPQWRLRDPDSSDIIVHEHPVFVKGLYEVLLHLDSHIELGDLNNFKVVHSVTIPGGAGEEHLPLILELRFPDWASEQPELYELFSGNYPEFNFTALQLTRFSRDRELAEPVSDASFAQGWRNLFFADFSVSFETESGGSIYSFQLNAIPIRFFSHTERVKNSPNIVNTVSTILEDMLAGGIWHRYHRKLLARAVAIEQARFALHDLRNLSEDYCRTENIKTEDIAFCADVDLDPEADIENVLAHIYYTIEKHLNPPVPFYTLQELKAEGWTTEEIFLGPPLENGFIKDADLKASELRGQIHISDLYNKLMDIPGIRAIRNVLFTRYDDLGNPVMPAHHWQIPIRPLHIPRLYQLASRVLFYKNDLPFLARTQEVQSILAQLRGQDIRGKVPLASIDFPVPVGRHRQLNDYTPIQHTLPLTYGIGPIGLDPRVSNQRKAQARQLKGYLMPFEQLLADMSQQLARTPDLFSTDEAVDQTYFSHFFDPAAAQPEIADLAALSTSVATEDNLKQLAESPSTFADRRNRFLDHLLARFGEQFRDYALMLYANADRIPFSNEKLIRDKIRFLRFYPRISADRARAFNYRYTDCWCDSRNRAGLSERIGRLLGMDSLLAFFDVAITSNQGIFSATFTLTDNSEGGLGLLLQETEALTAATGEAAEEMAWQLVGHVIANSTEIARYDVNGNGDQVLLNESDEEIALLAPGITPAQVVDFCSDLLAKERLLIVEHLLLRPVFPGSPLMKVCLDPDCNTLCGEEDPYSFRLTYVMQGSLAPFSYDIDLRRFADQTIRRETPSHLLPKICWVGNQGIEKDDCAPIISRLVDLLQQEQGMDGQAAATCDCAHQLYDGFDAPFQFWMTGQESRYRPRAAWDAELRTLFSAFQASDFSCLTSDNGWDRISEALLEHFIDLAVNAMQFDRFEIAWCQWLEANDPFDWFMLNTQLQRQTELWLQSSLGTEASFDGCKCASRLLAYFGDRYRSWIDGLVEAEADLELLGALETEMETVVWENFLDDLWLADSNDGDFCLVSFSTEGEAAQGLLQLIPRGDARWVELRALWLNFYTDWIIVSVRLNILLRQFDELKSIYPGATLHDCDDGSDDNPVRLDNTILGTL